MYQVIHLCNQFSVAMVSLFGLVFRITYTVDSNFSSQSFHLCVIHLCNQSSVMVSLIGWTSYHSEFNEIIIN